jgi:hypothetical protein
MRDATFGKGGFPEVKPLDKLKHVPRREFPGVGHALLRVGQRLRQLFIRRWRQTVLLDQINYLGQAYGRNANLAP